MPSHNVTVLLLSRCETSIEEKEENDNDEINDDDRYSLVSHYLRSDTHALQLIQEHQDDAERMKNTAAIAAE